MLEILALLIFGHYIADYPLQGDFLAKAKNKFSPIDGVPWYQAVAAHTVMHGGIVGIITGSLWLGIAETVIHFAIDHSKCKNVFGFNVDQMLHILCKVVWVAFVALGWY